MPLLILQHDEAEHAGRLGDILSDLGHRLEVRELFGGDAVPGDLDGIDGVISLGGAYNAFRDAEDAASGEQEPSWLQPEKDLLRAAHEAEVPVLGICLGAQLLAVALGGEVGPLEAEHAPEVGFQKVTSTFFGSTDPLLVGLPWASHPFHLHGQQVTKAPPGGTPIPLQGSRACKVQAFRSGLTSYGIQYHFEWTRKMMVDVLDANQAELTEAGVDLAAVKASFDDHYPLSRHLGDRLCQNLAKLLFPIDKRLPPVGVSVENFRA
ncbi:type 1 glutamine amidotransferase [Phycisphaera mikurensis]|uniref:Glutamine amidotransferase domain-containing protein n=1 Tax=Phycisphaera mikurensis (strain NBRC 102666 / KCTC 22515 / FYK2301M01) TaxID=1142394 RepID=I0IH12_PHYMF|nr:type 1 glutamine amidotransferase [Phycisphaera mikurensis]MBB6440805.1 GMP synthase-like glutamine amidotransferase [Phycisphaera mikurensis]BAM04550.1 hypothetical protein PSMK_23910 [Phycisphaera mikurensis NBRC 102666]